VLTEFDQTTIANMTAALDFVCKKIPADKDSNELRKRIGDELVRCARMGRRSLIDLQQAGMKVMEETAKPDRFSWFGWKWRGYSPDRQPTYQQPRSAADRPVPNPDHGAK